MSDLVAAIAEKNAIEAQLAALKLRIARGELVDRRDLERKFQGLALRIRDHFMTAPSRHAAELGAKYQVDPAQLSIVLERIMRNLLTRASERKP